jgi:hypothetical protein
VVESCPTWVVESAVGVIESTCITGDRLEIPRRELSSANVEAGRFVL